MFIIRNGEGEGICLMSPGESVTEQGHVLGALAPPDTSLDLVASHANGFHAQRALPKAPSECEEDAC